MKMKTFIILNCLLVCALAVPNLSQWNNWKKLYGRNYDLQEEYHRQKIFFRNLKKIELHNKQADAGIHTYRLGLNQFADLTFSEFSSKMQLNNYTSHKTRKQKPLPSSNDKKYPDSFDWRTKGVVAPIKSMEECPASYAFAAVSTIETAQAIYHGNLTVLSEQNIIDCSTSFGNSGCHSGDAENAFFYVMANGGLDTEASYPNIYESGVCKFTAKGIGALLYGFYEGVTGDEQFMLEFLVNKGTTAVKIDASSPSFQFYSSGVYTDDKCSSENLNLQLVAVGYDSLNGQDYWIVRNAWGTSWGNEGYIWMARNRNNMCGIATSASTPIVN